jgi:hypothetical protein
VGLSGGPGQDQLIPLAKVVLWLLALPALATAHCALPGAGLALMYGPASARGAEREEMWFECMCERIAVR